MRLRWPKFGFLDGFAATLLIFAASWYFVTPDFVERSINPLVYDPASNSYASLQCVREKNASPLFTRNRDFAELKDGVEVVDWSDLYRYAKAERTGRLVEYRMPEPDAGCVAANGFVEMVSRWEYHFGGSAKAAN
jgi:hypothetical protein